MNEIICHGIPDTRELQEGDIVNIDITTYVYIHNLWCIYGMYDLVSFSTNEQPHHGMKFESFYCVYIYIGMLMATMVTSMKHSWLGRLMKMGDT